MLVAPSVVRTGAAPARLIRVGLAMLGAIAVACALLAQHPANVAAVPGWVIVVSLLAIAGAAIAFPAPTSSSVDTVVEGYDAVKRLATAAIVLGGPSLVALLLWSRENFARTHDFELAGSSVAAALWLGGIAAGLALLWPGVGDGLAGMRSRISANWPQILLEAIALIVILEVAAGLRLWHLASLPEGIWFDEADFANSALRLLHMPFQPFGPGEVGHEPSLYFYVMAVLIKLGGTSMAVVRLPSAIFGVLAAVAVYLLGRKAGGVPLGLCAAALMAMAAWAVDFSRLAMSNIATPAMISFGFAAFCIAMVRPRAFWFALAGVLLGFSLLTYLGAFLPSGGVAVAVVSMRLLSSRQFRQAAWPGLLFLPLGIAVGIAPLLAALWLDHTFTLARAQQVSLLTEYPDWPHRLTALQDNVRAHLLMFTVAGDNNGRHNLPGAPMVDVVTGACLLLGLGICLRRIYCWFYLLLVLWMATSLLGGILSLDFEAPQGARTIGAVAPLALIAALPLALLARAVWCTVLGFARSPGESLYELGVAGTPRALAAIAAAAVVTALPLGVAFARNYDNYFVQHAADISSWSEMGGRQAIIGRAAAALIREGYTVRVSPALTGDPALEWAAGGRLLDAYDPDVPVSLPVPSGGLALIIPVDDADVYGFVHRMYPFAQQIALAPSFDSTKTQANVVLIRPQDAARNIGVSVRFGNGTVAKTFDQAPGQLRWPVGSGPATHVIVRGTLQIGRNEAWHPLALRAAGVLCASITIDDSTWAGASTGTPAIRLGAGNHSLVVQGDGRAGETLSIQWALDGANWSVVPPLVLAAPTLPTGGLLGMYYLGAAVQGLPVLERVDQTAYSYYQNPPVGTGFPFAADWLGTLHVAQSGIYEFALDTVGGSTLFIDGQAVLQGGPQGMLQTRTLSLTRGRHAIQLEYSASGSYLHCYLTWKPPGQAALTPIPPSVTKPAHG